VVDAPTQAIDLFPTLLELAGLPVPPQAQGTSMTGLLDGTDDGSRRKAFAVMPDYAFTALTTPRWKLIRNNGNGAARLYDRVHDPEEKFDRYAAAPTAARRLTGELQAWMKAVKITS
jgi:arylsulfatase A-like enzyme